jgi:hypothetical protein
VRSPRVARNGARDARLLVIGGSRLVFEIASAGEHAELRVFIGYDLPSSPGPRVLGHFFGPIYARWCVRRMVDGARAFLRSSPRIVAALCPMHL